LEYLIVMSQRYELESKFRTAFSNIDNILSFEYYDLRPSILSDISSITFYLNIFLNRYYDVLSDEEKSIIQERIDHAIDRLILLNIKHYYVLYYFKRNISNNPRSTILRSQSILLSIRTLFETSINKIPLESTIWNFFSDNISDFVKNLNSTLNNCDDKMFGNLAFLVLITINCLVSIKKSLQRNINIKKKDKIIIKVDQSLTNIITNLITLYQDKKLEKLMEKSPGFVVFLYQVLNKDDLLHIPNNINIKSLIKKMIQMINFDNVSNNTKNFYILNAMELGESPPKGITPSGNDPLALLADGFIRLENGESLLGITPRIIYSTRK